VPQSPPYESGRQFEWLDAGDPHIMVVVVSPITLGAPPPFAARDDSRLKSGRSHWLRYTWAGDDASDERA
jgi:hypothetical protein